MTRGKPVAALVAIASLMLVLSGCIASHSQTSSTSSSAFSSSISSTGAALADTAQGKEPSLGETSRAKDTAAFVAYWKRQGYTITADRQALKPDGTVKTFRFAASRRKKGADGAGTITATITDTPPPDTGSQEATPKASAIKAAAKKAPPLEAPPLNGTSTAKDAAAYAAFYERHGYKITLNQQTYHSDGTVQEFHFAAKHGQGANQSSVSANIDGATHNVSTSENANGTSSP